MICEIEIVCLKTIFFLLCVQVAKTQLSWKLNQPFKIWSDFTRHSKHGCFMSKKLRKRIWNFYKFLTQWNWSDSNTGLPVLELETVPLMFHYVAAKFIFYTLSHFLSDFY